MSDAPPRPGGPPAPEFEAAQRVLFDVLERDLIVRGTPEAIPFLRQVLRARHEETRPGPQGRRIVRLRVFGDFTTYSARYNARTGEQTAMTMGALIDHSGRELTREEALAAATETLRPPDDAVLDLAEYDEASGEPFFVVRWAHVHAGARVENDHIQAMLNGRSKRIFSWSRKWHTVSTEVTAR